MKILLVEDDKHWRYTALALLEHFGHKVAAPESTTECERLLGSNQQFDALLLDESLWDKTRIYDFAKQIRRRAKAGARLFCFSSSEGAPDSMAQAFGVLVSAELSKRNFLNLDRAELAAALG